MARETCGKYYAYLEKHDGTDHRYAFLPTYCKSWTCPRCRKLKAAKVRTFIKKSFEGKKLWMLSITFFHNGSPLDAWKSIGKKCNRMLTYARKYSGQFDYIRIVEPHKDGIWPHIHILCTKPISSTEFVKLITKWGFGWNFHSKPVSANHAANYVSKYLTKEWPTGTCELDRQISRTRIVSASRSLGPIFKRNPSWTIVKLKYPEYSIPWIRQTLYNTALLKDACVLEFTDVGSGFTFKTDVIISPDFVKEFNEEHLFNDVKVHRGTQFIEEEQQSLPF